MKLKKAIITATIVAILGTTAAVAVAASDNLSDTNTTKKGMKFSDRQGFMLNKNDFSGAREDLLANKEDFMANRKKFMDDKENFLGMKHEFMNNQDPQQALEDMKSKLQEKVQNGNITQEKADQIIADLEAKLKEFQEFQSLSLEEKKAKLIDGFTKKINSIVEAGKLTEEKAKELIQKHTEKINEWDGTGYPNLKEKGFDRGPKLGRGGKMVKPESN